MEQREDYYNFDWCRGRDIHKKIFLRRWRLNEIWRVSQCLRQKMNQEIEKRKKVKRRGDRGRERRQGRGWEREGAWGGSGKGRASLIYLGEWYVLRGSATWNVEKMKSLWVREVFGRLTTPTLHTNTCFTTSSLTQWNGPLFVSQTYNHKWVSNRQEVFVWSGILNGKCICQLLGDL